MAVHPTAVVEDGAVLGADVSIGPFCMIGPNVELGDGAVLHSHVALAGHTRIGAGAQIFPFASIGHQAQDLKFRGEHATLTVGANCLIREGVTMNAGTEGGGGHTVIGDNCAFLANSHVGHDCRVGNHVVMSNGALLAGHVQVGDFVIFGGGSAAIQFSRIGSHAFVGGLSGLEKDLIPFGLAVGDRASLAGLNLVGLRRRNFDRDAVAALRRAYRMLFAAEGTLKERTDRIADEYPDVGLVQDVVSFIRAGGDRALCTPAEATRDTEA